MVYSANLFYLTIQIDWDPFPDGARTCARAARISSILNEMLFLKDFYIDQLYERPYSARQEISASK